MATPMVEYARVPHRKPLPGHTSAAILPTHSQPVIAAQNSTPPQLEPSPRFSTLSSQPSYGTMNNNYGGALQARRTLSNATSSTTSSNQNSIRRSSSGRSAGPSPTSYVALLRKQKATVWCDRTQAEDPRIRVQQRLAKERAEREVVAGPGPLLGRSTPPSVSSGSFTGGVARKIRHHGGKPVQYTGGNMVGAGVPLRLSATEVDDDLDNDNRYSKQEEEISNEWERDPAWGYAGARPSQNHRRTGSGRSSLGSQRRATGSGLGYASQPRFSTTSSTPTSGHSRSPSETHLHGLAEQTPLASQQRRGSNYFVQKGGSANTPSSAGSGNSSRENSFGAMGALPEKLEDSDKKATKDTTDDLMRRGSVDERTMTMGRNVRLFVANPDPID